MKINLEIPCRKVFVPLFEDSERFKVVVAHRRCGKTVAAVQKLIADALKPSKRTSRRYGYVAPFRHQAKASAWDYAKRMSKKIPRIQISEAELRIDYPNGSRVQLYGADNPDSLRGTYFDGCVLDEYATMNPITWTQVLRPALSDRQGWAVWIGTPAGPNAFKRLYEDASKLPGWKRYMLRVEDTGLIAPDELEALKREMPEEDFEQEYECSFEAAVRGAYYGKQMAAAVKQGRITSVPHEPGHSVETWWDLGVRDQTVIWCVQRIGTQTRVIDLISATGEGLPYFVRELQRKPYSYSRHVAPHDIAVRELGTGQSRYETARELGIHFDIAPQLPIVDGIDATRRMLDSCWFDEDRCDKGIDALKLYRASFDEKHGVFQAKPLHSWESHYADAMRTGAVVSGYLAEHHYKPDVMAAFPDRRERRNNQMDVSWNEPIPYQ